MKLRTPFLTLVVALLAASGSAQARDRYETHHDHYRAQTSHPVRAHFDHHRGYRHEHRFDRRSWRHRKHEHHDAARALASAILIGTLVNAFDNDDGRYKRERQRNYRHERDGGWNGASYRRDRVGDCFEVYIDRNGHEVWTLTRQSYCY